MDEEPSQEALVFYELASSTPGTSVRINILDQKDGRWISTYDAVVPASEVEKVSLIAVDRRKYLVIGFNQLGSPNKIILIYSYEDGRLEKKFQTTCSNYEVMDLDGDKQTELVTISAEDGEADHQLWVFGPAEQYSTGSGGDPLQQYSPREAAGRPERPLFGRHPGREHPDDRNSGDKRAGPSGEPDV